MITIMPFVYGLGSSADRNPYMGFSQAVRRVQGLGQIVVPHYIGVSQN